MLEIAVTVPGRVGVASPAHFVARLHTLSDSIACSEKLGVVKTKE